MEKEKDNIIKLSSEDGDVEVEVIDQTIIDGITYLLVSEIFEDGENEDCCILKEIPNENSNDIDYEMMPYDEAEKIFDIFEKKSKENRD